MSEPFLGEIRIFTCDYPPKGWALCEGQLLSIRQYTALFSILGTYYGGDGHTTFALPDLRGRVPLDQGEGPGRSSYAPGEFGGVEYVTLQEAQLPPHTHGVTVSLGDANARTPADEMLASGIGIGMYGQPPAGVRLDPRALSTVGGNQPHNNMQPYLACNFCIALQGIFPTRP